MATNRIAVFGLLLIVVSIGVLFGLLGGRENRADLLMVGAVCGIVGLMACFLRPWWAYLAIVALLPASALNVTVGFNLTPLRALTPLLGVVLLVHALYDPEQRSWMKLRGWQWLLLYVVVAGVSGAYTGNLPGWMRRWFHLALVTLPLFAATGWLVRSGERLRTVCAVLVASSSLQALFALYVFLEAPLMVEGSVLSRFAAEDYVTPEEATGSVFEGETMDRVSGLAGCAESFGGAMLLALPFAIIGSAQSDRRRPLWLGAAAVIASGVLVSFTRAALIGLVLQLLLFLALGARSGRRPRWASRACWAAVVVTIVVAGAVAGHRLFRARVESILMPEAVEYSRTTRWQEALYALPQYPFGQGGGTYYVAVAPDRAPPPATRQPHNMYFIISLEIGWLGLAAYLLLNGAIVVGAWRATQRDPGAPDVPWVWAGIAAMLGYGVFLLSWGGIQLTEPFLAAAMVAAAARLALHREDALPSREPTIPHAVAGGD